MNVRAVVGLILVFFAGASPESVRGDAFQKGVGIPLAGTLPANERGIVCLSIGPDGRIFGGTTGRAAHLFRYDPEDGKLVSLTRLSGGIGLSYGLVRLPDGSLIAGTQADPTGLAVTTDAGSVGHLYRFVIAPDDSVRAEDLGTAVAGQGIYSLAYLPETDEIVGNTWPEGHFFTYDRKAKTFQDHGAIAGHRTYEIPRYADKINQGTDRNLKYTRQVSRAIAVDPEIGAYTAGADGFLYRYDPAAKKLEKLNVQLPAARGREAWASLDAVAVFPTEGDRPWSLVGGTSDGYLFELRVADPAKPVLNSWGKPFSQPGIQGLVGRNAENEAGQRIRIIEGISGTPDGMPRAFRATLGPEGFSLVTGGIPEVDGRTTMTGFGALVADAQGAIYAGECDRIARLVRYPLETPVPEKTAQRRAPAPEKSVDLADLSQAAKLPCRLVFAPEGTTTEASGYTAIEVGRDGHVYVGTARYGDYAWLLRFPGLDRVGQGENSADLPLFMEKVVNLRDLSGERRDGIHTQGKIHAKILVGEDGRIWFATKQAHEVFGTRPEYEDPLGFPGGHLCYYDPKTGFARSMGILKPREGLMAGALDEQRGKLYYHCEPKNHLIIYDMKSGEVRDAGHLGNNCRYMAIDSKGAIYTTGRGPTLCRFDPETGYVEDLAVKIEGEGGYSDPYVIALGPNGKLYGVRGGHPWIMEFDIAKADTSAGTSAAGPQVTMRNVAAAAPRGWPVLDIHAAAFGLDGKLYYPLNTGPPGGSRNERRLLIMRFDPATGESELVGTPDIQGFDEEQVKHTYIRENKYSLDHMQGAAVGPDGTLYLMDIYPQLNVACFPQLTAPDRKTASQK